MILRHAYVIGLAILASCSEAPEQETERLAAVDILAGGDTDGFLRATEPRTFTFPEDHGPHPGYRNEWWYLTGNVFTADGRRFGYQVTFFATAIRPDGSAGCANGNAWCTDYLWMGHAAVSIIENQTHMAAELFSRQAPGLAGARLDPFRVWIQDWQLFSASNGFPWELEVITDDFAITLRLVPEKQPVRQGDNGLSRKSADAGNASYYYSITRINTSGQIHINGVAHAVTGSSWLDREWSTSALAADQGGWDWFSLQFNDGGELMYYQLRDLEGGAHAYSSGNFTSLMGTQSAIARDELDLEELDSWQAPDGTDYTTRWRMRYRDNDWIIQAVFEDQLMDVTFQYWEGAVDVIERNSGELIGRGYLEMVR